MATKKCPFCAEEIQEEAIVCKHCGRDLEKGHPQERDTNSLSPGTRNLIWHLLLTADMHVHYFLQLALRYRKRDKNVKILLALTSSSSVATLAIWNLVPLWGVLASANTIVAISFPFMKWTEQIEDIASSHGQWTQLLSKYEQLWTDQDSAIDEGTKKEIEQLKKEENELARLETKLPYDKKLLRRCQEEVRKSRGI